MKKLLVFFLLSPILLLGQAQITVDTAQLGLLLRATANLNQDVKNLTVRTDTLTRRVDKDLKPGTCVFCQSKLSAGERWLVSVPLLLFIIASFYILTRLRQEGYRISDALKENYTVDIAKTPEAVTAQLDTQREVKAGGAEATNLAAAADTPTTEIRPQSTSRLIAFFAGMAAIIMSVSAVTFFFYVYLRTGQEPKFDSLWNVVLGLGVGVIPYAFNRIADALNPKTKQ